MLGFAGIVQSGRSALLLDTYSGAAAAYSLRKLRTAYTGSAVRVRRSIDNAEADIGFDANGNLNETALMSHVGYQNLLTYSEQFDTVWSRLNSSVTANVTTAPDNSSNADKITATAVGGGSVYQLAFFGSANVVYTASCHFKAAECGYGYMILVIGSSRYSVLFSLSNGSFVNDYNTSVSLSNKSYSINNIGNGWYRLSITATNSGAGGNVYLVATGSSTSNITFDGSLDITNQTAGNGVYLWGAQLNTGSLQPYQPTTSATLDGNGFVTTWYDQATDENLLTYSEQFDTVWVPVALSISANQIAAPDGTNTADKLIPNTSSTGHYIGRSPSFLPSGKIYVNSIYAKAGGYNYAGLSDGTTGQAVFNLTNGQVVSIDPSITSASSTDVGNGWYRLSIVFNATTIRNFGCDVWSNSTKTTYAGDGTSGIYVWGAQSNTASLKPYKQTTSSASVLKDATQATASAQPRIVNAGVVEKQGGKPTLYFDGVNDNIATSSTITLKTQITLFTVVKTIDSSKQFFTEHNSVNTYTTTNGFLFYGTDAAMWIFGRSPSLHYGYGNPNWLGTNQSLLTLYYNTKAFVYKNNVIVSDGAITGSTLSNTDYTDTLNICSRAGSSFFSNVNLSEYILYSSDKSSNRTSIESNINSYFNIY